MAVSEQKVLLTQELGVIADKIEEVNKVVDLYRNQNDDWFLSLKFEKTGVTTTPEREYQMVVNTNPPVYMSKETKNVFIQALKNALDAFQGVLPQQYEEKLAEINALQV